jgi:diaminopimelate decarboxylase
MRNLPFTKDALEAIVSKYPTPFHIYDEAGIRANVKRLQEAFAWNEGFREYFAVKALPNPVIMKLLFDSGCGMDCSSLTELMLSRAVGVTGHDVMFSSNDTPANEFALASEMGVLINLDDITHIDFLAANGGIPKTVCLRFNPGGEFLLGNTIMGNPGEAKYGMTREQLSEAVKKLQALGAVEFGLHAFLVSNTTDDDYYPALAKKLFKTAVELNEETGANFTFVNLSAASAYRIVRMKKKRISATSARKSSCNMTELSRRARLNSAFSRNSALYHGPVWLSCDACDP